MIEVVPVHEVDRIAGMNARTGRAERAPGLHHVDAARDDRGSGQQECRRNQDSARCQQANAGHIGIGVGLGGSAGISA